jgi:hypothetical protein
MMTREGQPSTHRYGSFDYTDISPSFFSSAQDIYQSHGKRMRFKVLNIENDPEAQGFECGTYDIIFAAAVRPHHISLRVESTGSINNLLRSYTLPRTYR